MRRNERARRSVLRARPCLVLGGYRQRFDDCFGVSYSSRKSTEGSNVLARRQDETPLALPVFGSIRMDEGAPEATFFFDMKNPVSSYRALHEREVPILAVPPYRFNHCFSWRTKCCTSSGFSRSAFTMRSVRIDCEPLTSTMSPSRMNSARGAAASLEV